MLKISGETLEVFEVKQSNEFYTRTISFIRENVPKASSMADNALKEHIFRCKNFMQEKHLFSEQAIVLWSVLFLATEGHIAKQEPIRKILDAVNEPERRRLDAIVVTSGR